MSAIDINQRVASPCIGKCTLDDDDVCVGCFRNIDEICAWGAASDRERERIVKQARARRENRAGRA